MSIRCCSLNYILALLQTTGGRDEPNKTSFLCKTRNGHHNTELRTQRYTIGQHKH